MNIYKITKLQLLVFWIFGLGVWFSFWNEFGYSYNANEIFLLWAVPFVLIFYTIGWKKYNGFFLNKTIREKIKNNKKVLVWASILLAVIIITIFIIIFIKENSHNTSNLIDLDLDLDLDLGLEDL